MMYSDILMKIRGKNMIEVCKDYYVYVYLDPRKSGKVTYDGLNGYYFDYEPFYIGKGIGGRKYHHLHTARGDLKGINRNTNNYTINKCASILRQGYEPIIIEFLSGLIETKAYELEEYLIKCIGRKSHSEGYLTNYQRGGEFTGHDWHSDEHKENMRLSQLGRTHSDETKRKMSENNGMSNSEVLIKNQKSRCLKVFSKMKEFNHTFSKNKFNSINYELARSKLYARAYPNWDKMCKIFEIKEVQSYFSQDD